MINVRLKLDWFVQFDIDELFVWLKSQDINENDWNVICEESTDSPIISFAREVDALAFKIKFCTTNAIH
jgi:hypothetical protein